jgi:hypothetical protein
MAKNADIAKPVVITSSTIQMLSTQQRIFIIRGKHVMVDRDLAFLYGVETRVLKQAVNRNPERFPEEFMFQLDNQEFEKWRSQIVMSKSDKMGLRHRPYVFTEQGVAMLSAVLKSPTAVSVSIGIMNAFVAARRLMLQNREHELAIEELRMKMKMLEDALENNLGAVNDLSEEMRKELDNIYDAIGALSVKVQDPPKAKMNPVGFAATASRYEEEEKRKNQ